MRVMLDADNWAEIKEVTDLRRGERRAVNAAIVFEGDAKSGNPIIHASLDDDMVNALAPFVVIEWSLPLPLPAKDISALDKLTLEQDDSLRKALQPHIDACQGKGTPVKAHEDPTTVSGS
jgi:hypothetical protein